MARWHVRKFGTLARLARMARNLADSRKEGFQVEKDPLNNLQESLCGTMAQQFCLPFKSVLRSTV